MTSIIIHSSIFLLLVILLLTKVNRLNPYLLKPITQFLFSIVIFFLYTYAAVQIFHNIVFVSLLLFINLYFLVFRKNVFVISLIPIFSIIIALNALNELYYTTLFVLYLLSIPIVINRYKEFLIALLIPMIITFTMINNEEKYYYLLLFLITSAILFVIFHNKEKSIYVKELAYSDIIVIASSTFLCLTADTELDYAIATFSFIILLEKTKNLRFYLFLFLCFYTLQLQSLNQVSNYIITSIVLCAYIYFEKYRKEVKPANAPLKQIDFSNPKASIVIDKALLQSSDLTLIQTYYRETETDNHFVFNYTETRTDTVCVFNLKELKESEALDFIKRVNEFLPKYVKPVAYCNELQKTSIVFMPYLQKITNLAEYIEEIRESEKFQYLLFIENNIDLYDDFFDRFLDHLIDLRIDILFPMLSFSNAYQNPEFYHSTDKELTIDEIYSSKRQEKVEIEFADTSIFLMNLKDINFKKKSDNLNELLFQNDLRTFLALDICFINKQKEYRINYKSISLEYHPENKNIGIFSDNLQRLYSYPLDMIKALDKKYNFFLLNPSTFQLNYDLYLNFSDNKIEFAHFLDNDKLVFHDLKKIDDIIVPTKNQYTQDEFKLDLYVLNPINLESAFSILQGKVYPEQCDLIYKHTKSIYINKTEFSYEIYDAFKYAHNMISEHPKLRKNDFDINNIENFNRDDFLKQLTELQNNNVQNFTKNLDALLSKFFVILEIMKNKTTFVCQDQNNDEEKLKLLSFAKNNNISLIFDRNNVKLLDKNIIRLNFKSVNGFYKLNILEDLNDEQKILAEIKTYQDQSNNQMIIDVFSKHPFVVEMPIALNEIAVAYYNLKDFENARKFFMLAKDLGNQDAEANFQDLETFLTNEHQRETENLKPDSTDSISH